MPVGLARKFPWLRVGQILGSPGGGTTVPPPPPPGPPSLSHAGTNKQFIGRDPLVDPRTRQHTERVAVILNSLMRQGQLYVAEDGEWEVAVGPGQIEIPDSPGGSGLTGTFPA